MTELQPCFCLSGGQGWAVVGQVPGVGPVGAAVGTRELADALRQHMLTRPAEELAAWAVTAAPVTVPPLPERDRVDLAAFVEQLDPGRADDRAVARALRGVDRRTDAAIRGRFRDVDLDAPFVVAPPATTPSFPWKRQSSTRTLTPFCSIQAPWYSAELSMKRQRARPARSRSNR